MTILLKDIEEALARIAPHIRKTSLEHSSSCSTWLGTETFLKYENKQRTGSFKIRGALNKIMQSTDEQKAKGFVAASAGNHAQGVAFSATSVGSKSYIVMPEQTPLIKLVATQSYGGEAILHGRYYDECYAHARQLEKEKGYTYVHAFEDEQVIAGQGTVGLEILEQVKDLDSIVIAVGGGGLISGIATAVKAINPKCRIFGATAKNAPGMDYMFHKKKYDAATFRSTIADGIAVKSPSSMVYDKYISRLVDDIHSVDEDQIAKAMVYLLERSKTIVEGAGAVGLAAASEAGWDLGKKTCIVLCGGNIDLNLVAQVVDRGLSHSGRIARLSVKVIDQPGVLKNLTAVLAEKNANILEVHHDRRQPHLRLGETVIRFVVETKNDRHIKVIRKALEATGATLRD